MRYTPDQEHMTIRNAKHISAYDVAAADASVMLEKVSAVSEAHHYYKGKPGRKDMQFWIDFACGSTNMKFENLRLLQD